ncbi:NAD-dependent epimerase/dehydratase family protein [Bernardetia sp. OM2101]|uniref:NAD-dependent epimerase/dehydratase family protein n=1 Tax=Bernardetia sp. OM2101 TaxID=3344876 RepID=UPI0035D0CBDA
MKKITIDHFEWIIFGGGAVVQEFYIPAFRTLELLQNVLIVEPSQKEQEKLLNTGVKVIQQDFESFLSNYDTKNKSTLVIIALPNFLHVKAMQICIEKELDVLCEKPLTLDEKSSLQLYKQAKEKNVIVAAAMVKRKLASLKSLQFLLSSHLIGEIEDVKVSDGSSFGWSADSYAFFDGKNGGVLADMGIHYLDMFYMLFGDLKPISYEEDWKGRTEANCTYCLQTEKNIPITLQISRTHLLENRFEIIGTKGKAWMEKNDFEKVFFQNKSDDTIKTLRDETPFVASTQLTHTFEAAFVEQIYDFAQTVISHKEGKEPSYVDAKQASKIVALVEWAYQQRNKSTAFVKKEASKYLITGGTGFIGTALINRLAEEGHQITAPVRRYQNCAPIAKWANVEMPRLNLLDYQAVKEATKGKEYIFHLAVAADGNNAYEVNVNGTKNLVKAATENGVKGIVITSTMNVYGFPKSPATNGVIDETWNNKRIVPAGGNYGATKAVMQKWALDWAKKNPQMHLSIVNPTCVYGVDGKTYTTLPYDLRKINRFCWIDNGQGIANYVYIDNLLDAMLLALQTPNAHGENYIINDGYTTWKEFLTPLLLDKAQNIPSLTKNDLETESFNKSENLIVTAKSLLGSYEMMEIINRNPSLKSLKKIALSLTPNVKQKIYEHRESSVNFDNIMKPTEQPFNPPAWLNDLFGNTVTKLSSQKAIEQLNWTPKIGFEEGMKLSTEWMKEKVVLDKE